MDDIFMIDKNLMRSIIDTLKKVKPDNYDSMLALCLAVNTLDEAINAPKPEEHANMEETADA